MLRTNILSNRHSRWSNLGSRVSNLRFQITVCLFAIGCLGSTAYAQQQAAGGARYDVTNYRIEVQLNPNEHTLRAGAKGVFIGIQLHLDAIVGDVITSAAGGLLLSVSSRAETPDGKEAYGYLKS